MKWFSKFPRGYIFRLLATFKNASKKRDKLSPSFVMARFSKFLFVDKKPGIIELNMKLLVRLKIFPLGYKINCTTKQNYFPLIFVMPWLEEVLLFQMLNLFKNQNVNCSFDFFSQCNKSCDVVYLSCCRGQL